MMAETTTTAAQVEEVFAIESGLQLVTFNLIGFDVSNLPQESRKQQDTSLMLFTTNVSNQEGDHIDRAVRRVALMKCGSDIYYPLEKNKSLVFKQERRTYLFPPADGSSSPPSGQWIVVTIGKDAPDYVVDQFEDLLKFFASVVEEIYGANYEVDAIMQLVNSESQSLYPTLPLDQNLYRRQDTPYTPPTAKASLPSSADKVAQGLVHGAGVIAGGIGKGTVLAEKLIRLGAEKARASHATPEPQKAIDPNVISGLKKARVAAQTASSVTGACVSAIATGTNALGRQLAPHVQHHGSKLISGVTGKSATESSSTMSGILTVAAGGLQGIGTIYNGIAESAVSIARTVANETVGFVGQKYGGDAGQAAHEALYTAGNVALTVNNLNVLTPKGAMKRAAAETGKGVISKGIKRDSDEDEDGSNTANTSRSTK